MQWGQRCSLLVIGLVVRVAEMAMQTEWCERAGRQWCDGSSSVCLFASSSVNGYKAAGHSQHGICLVTTNNSDPKTYHAHVETVY